MSPVCFTSLQRKGLILSTHWFGSVPLLTYLISLSLALSEVCVGSEKSLRRFQSKWHFWSVMIGWRLHEAFDIHYRIKKWRPDCPLSLPFSLALCLSLNTERFKPCFSSFLSFRGENYHCLGRKDYSSFPFQISLLWHHRRMKTWGQSIVIWYV